MLDFGDLVWDWAGNGIEVAELGKVVGAVVSDAQMVWC